MGDEANVAEVLRRGTHYGRIEYDDYTSFVGRVKNGEEMIGEFVDTRKKKPLMVVFERKKAGDPNPKMLTIRWEDKDYTVAQTAAKRAREEDSQRAELVESVGTSTEEEEEAGIFEVKTILKRRVKDGRVEYKVQWKGFTMSDCTWEPLANLVSAKKMIAAFEQDRKETAAATAAAEAAATEKAAARAAEKTKAKVKEERRAAFSRKEAQVALGKGRAKSAEAAAAKLAARAKVKTEAKAKAKRAAAAEEEATAKRRKTEEAAAAGRLQAAVGGGEGAAAILRALRAATKAGVGAGALKAGQAEWERAAARESRLGWKELVRELTEQAEPALLPLGTGLLGRLGLPPLPAA